MRSWLIILALLPLFVQGQNLVPNPSFEEHTECPDGPGKIAFAYPWENVLGSCDYFNECGTNGYRASANIVGGGGARTGQANGHFLLWSINNQQTEILGIELITEMEAGVRYRVEFYLSMTDSIWYASKNFGAYFSAVQPPNDIDNIQSCQPQVRYEGAFITNKEGWTRVSGTFVAQGGERFLSIGNLDKYEDTETLFVPGGGVYRPQQPVYWSSSAYFIDDVSVVPDSTTSIQEAAVAEKGMAFELWPNPAKEFVQFRISDSSTRSSVGMTVQVLDALGRSVAAFPLQKGVSAGRGISGEVDVSTLPTGIYFLQLTDEEGKHAVSKFVKE
ncbi:MAG: T9SS type A sorting domain-containing protein [Flavobacteriales bacterium]|nr:T9SS type A sorting domain-containing protein [Flavobacteriales bacterium]